MFSSTLTTPRFASGALSGAADLTLEKAAIRIRTFESCLLDLFKEGKVFGTLHTCIGQEFCAAALHAHLKPGRDAFFATHRGHGHYLAHGGPEDALIAELMGREGALCLGRGGTQNLHFQHFFSAGIQGSSAPVATGFAHALRHQGIEGMVVAQIGDGTLGEGNLYEAFTFAALLKAPILFYLEYNGWAQSTDVRTTTPGDILKRAAGFGLDSNWIEDTDPRALCEHLRQVTEYVRKGNPFLQVVETRRLMAHSKGDDNRPPDHIARLWQTDPLTKLLAENEELLEFEASQKLDLAALAEKTFQRPLLSDAHESALPSLSRPIPSMELHAETSGLSLPGRIVEELNRSLHEIFQNHPEVFVLGEDLLDPYGGAFKVTRGLSTEFPERVFSTPIAEAGIVGMANGMALAGMRPVAEIMFADFVTLASDQLINFAAKFYYMYGQRVRCPITVRLVSGAGRGYGPTHSQSLERMFCGVPGLRVVAVSQRHNVAALLKRAIVDDDGPTLFVENKMLYSLRPLTQPPLDLEPADIDEPCEDYPALGYRPVGSQAADVTLVTYGGTTTICESAMQALIEQNELRFDYFVLTQLWPLRLEAIIDSVRRTKRLVVVEEGQADFGMAAAVISCVTQELGAVACRAVGANPTPIPAVRHLEDQVLPTSQRVVQAVADVLHLNKRH